MPRWYGIRCAELFYHDGFWIYVHSQLERNLRIFATLAGPANPIPTTAPWPPMYALATLQGIPFQEMHFFWHVLSLSGWWLRQCPRFAGTFCRFLCWQLILINFKNWAGSSENRFLKSRASKEKVCHSLWRWMFDGDDLRLSPAIVQHTSQWLHFDCQHHLGDATIVKRSSDCSDKIRVVL
jgi:hypothetical protein